MRVWHSRLAVTVTHWSEPGVPNLGQSSSGWSALVNKTTPITPTTALSSVLFCFHTYIFSSPDIPYINDSTHTRKYIKNMYNFKKMMKQIPVYVHCSYPQPCDWLVFLPTSVSYYPVIFVINNFLVSLYIATKYVELSFNGKKNFHKILIKIKLDNA